jgi:hypothetical protein
MIVVDIFVVCICVAAAIQDTPLHHIHPIMNVPSTMSPLTFPLITIEKRRLWVTLRLVVSIDSGWRVSGEALVVVIHVSEVLLMNRFIYNIPLCIWIMIFLLHILRSISAYVGLIPH